MDPLNLLERMASISPGVRLHITGRLWLEHIDEDEVDHQMLVNECFSLMIGEAYELGIEFYCTLGDLCESLYTIDKTMLLFEVVFPTPLYRSITESDAFEKMISSVVLNSMTVNDESSIETILEHLALYNDKTAAIFLETYNFLQDKMKSTPVFDAYVKSTLDVNNTPFTVEVDKTVISEYLASVQEEYSALLKAADYISKKTTVDKNIISSMYEAINNYKIVASSADTLDLYSWVYDKNKEDSQLPKVQILIEKYKTQFHASVPFFEEYFILRNIFICDSDVVPLILGAFLQTHSREPFVTKVSDMFDKLQANGKIITSDKNILIQTVMTILIQEYYS